MLSVLRNRAVTLIKCCSISHLQYSAPMSTVIVKYINNNNFTTSNQVNLQIQTVRFKSKKHRNKATQVEETESDDDKEESTEIQDKHTKILNASVNSMRLDLILKSGLGMARSKIETLFYESRIRLNGQRVLKKSEQVSEGDEIDVIKGYDTSNPEFLVVARVEVMSAKPKGEGLTVKLRRNKSLTIENYEDKWKAA